MFRLALKILCIYLLWVVVVVPVYRQFREKADESHSAVKKFYWWMSPMKDGW